MVKVLIDSLAADNKMSFPQLATSHTNIHLEAELSKADVDNLPKHKNFHLLGWVRCINVELVWNHSFYHPDFYASDVVLLTQLALCVFVFTCPSVNAQGPNAAGPHLLPDGRYGS